MGMRVHARGSAHAPSRMHTHARRRRRQRVGAATGVGAPWVRARAWALAWAWAWTPTFHAPQGLLLNACKSERIAREVHLSLPHLSIVCWRGLAADAAAKAFARGFYAALASGTQAPPLRLPPSRLQQHTCMHTGGHGGGTHTRVYRSLLISRPHSRHARRCTARVRPDLTPHHPVLSHPIPPRPSPLNPTVTDPSHCIPPYLNPGPSPTKLQTSPHKRIQPCTAMHNPTAPHKLTSS